jgi:hypothetical protein
MGNAKMRRVLGPEWLEVDGEADLAAAIHLGGLSLQLWDLNLRGSGRVGGRDVKLRGQEGGMRVWGVRWSKVNWLTACNGHPPPRHAMRACMQLDQRKASRA